MAAKSDFAQKLLHDLRLRKERMAASNQSSGHRDSYRNPGNIQRGSGQTKTLETIGGSNIANHRSRALTIQESSQQIVSYGGGRPERPESIKDLSMAFTYAVKNGKKTMNVDLSNSRNTNKMIDFLHQIGRRSLDVQKNQNGSGLVKHGSPPVPVLTNTQIKEISKGVQNLYDILISNSNGIEVGKELLKGARGLEESLKMLVSLQEASEMMVSPQRKSRITILEVDEEENEDRAKIVGRNQVALPRFSFDKPLKKPNLGLTDAYSKPLNHRRSASCGAEGFNGLQASDSKKSSEKGRISNVIAKLMGLEEVPEKLDSQKQVNVISRPEKDILVSFSDRKYQKSNDFDTSKVSGVQKTPSSVHEKVERCLKEETKVKMHQKRRSPKLKERIEKNKTVRKEKSHEIKLVSRNNLIQEPEKRAQKIKQDSPITKQKSKDSPLKEPKIRPFEENVKGKESEHINEKSLRQKKVDLSMGVLETKAYRKKDEVLKRKNGDSSNLQIASRHKLSVLQETKRKDGRLLGFVSSKREESNAKVSDSKKALSRTPLDESTKTTISSMPICKDYTNIINTNNLEEKTKPKKLSYTQVVLTTQEKQLKEILIKDQLFLSTTEALFKLNIPVGFLHVDDHNHHREETKLKLDCAYEILRRKGRSQELLVNPYMNPSVGGTTIRFLDELVKGLYKDLEKLRLYGRNACDEYDETNYLHHMLEKDICNKDPDVNSFWDFGWHTKTFAFVEKDEFMKEVEKDVLQRLVEEIVEYLSSIWIVV